MGRYDPYRNPDNSGKIEGHRLGSRWKNDGKIRTYRSNLKENANDWTDMRLQRSYKAPPKHISSGQNIRIQGKSDVKHKAARRPVKYTPPPSTISFELPVYRKQSATPTAPASPDSDAAQTATLDTSASVEASSAQGYPDTSFQSPQDWQPEVADPSDSSAATLELAEEPARPTRERVTSKERRAVRASSRHIHSLSLGSALATALGGIATLITCLVIVVAAIVGFATGMVDELDNRATHAGSEIRYEKALLLDLYETSTEFNDERVWEAHFAFTDQYGERQYGTSYGSMDDLHTATTTAPRNPHRELMNMIDEGMGTEYFAGVRNLGLYSDFLDGKRDITHLNKDLSGSDVVWVEIERPVNDPWQTRIMGTTATIGGFANLIPLLIILAASVVLFFLIRHGARKVSMIRRGVVTQLHFENREATNMSVNDQKVYRNRYSYETPRGKFRATITTHRSEREIAQRGLQVIYDPSQASKHLVVQKLPGGQMVDGSNVLRVASPGRALWVFAPAFAAGVALIFVVQMLLDGLERL